MSEQKLKTTLCWSFSPPLVDENLIIDSIIYLCSHPDFDETETTHQTISGRPFVRVKFLGCHYRLGLNPVKSKTLLGGINKTRYGRNHVQKMLV